MRRYRNICMWKCSSAFTPTLRILTLAFSCLVNSNVIGANFFSLVLKIPLFSYSIQTQGTSYTSSLKENEFLGISISFTFQKFNGTLSYTDLF